MYIFLFEKCRTRSAVGLLEGYEGELYSQKTNVPESQHRFERGGELTDEKAEPKGKARCWKTELCCQV